MKKLVLKLSLESKTLSPTRKAAIILGLVIIGAYSPVLFLDQTYNQSTPIPSEFLGYQEKSTLFGTTADRWGDFQAIWPELKLGTTLISQGQIPLWDPYVGIGQPLSADANVYVVSPLALGFLLPMQFWDIPLLIALWVAGIFTFLFLRNLGLGFTASTSGGIFYMLSGGFSWFLTNPNVAVMVFTPFILYSLEKIIVSRNPKYIVLGSIGFCFAILGGHLESIILQLLLIVLFLCYRVITLTLLKRREKVLPEITINNAVKSVTDTKRILSWSAVAFVGGLGLSAFFLFPIYEFIEHNTLEHDSSTGIQYYPPLNLLSGFVPYILGQLHVYWFSVVAGMVGQWGYVGVLALFFSILGVLTTKHVSNKTHRYTPIFFLAVSVFFIMKTIGIPIANWIGYLPILNLVLFSHYLGVIIPFGFAVSAAFGIDLLSKSKITRKNLVLAFAISISIIVLLLIPIVPYLSPDAKFPSYVTANDARNYVAFQIIQSMVFALMALLTSIATIKNKSAILGVVSIILLELSLYIPVGLHPLWMAYKSIVVLVGMAVITCLVIKPNRLAWNTSETRNIRLLPIVIILLATFAGEVVVSDLSPFGMMKRFDSFQENPVTDFLKENLGASRMFSFDYSLGPSYPAGYQISTIGQFSAYNINSFYNFLHSFLDQKADAGRLGFPPWTYSYGPMESIHKFFENKKYFDFLGVKYVLTEGYDFNTFAPAIPGISGQYAKVGSYDNSTGQSFISPTNSISAIGISFGTSQLQNQGNLILTMDSIPRDQKYHRQSTINQTINQQFNEFRIDPPLGDVLNKEFYLSLKSQQTNNNELAAVFTVKENQTGFDLITNKLHGKFYENGLPVLGKQMVFSIVSDSGKYPIAFKFRDIRVYENPDAFPRSFLVNKFQTVNDGKAQEFLAKNPDFDLRHDVILEEQLPQDLMQQLNSPPLSESKAEVVLFTANKIIINTYNDQSSLLVLTDIYYPGWHAFVDGKETHIYRADGLVRTIFVPSGNHSVEFSYMPQSFVIGLSISLITAGLLSALFVYSKRKRAMIESTT